jgi:hypothetical protein
MRVCASNSPECSGVIPCEECFEYLKGKVLPRALFLSGAEDPLWVSLFISSFAQALHESVMEIRQSVPAPEPSEPRPHVGIPESEYLAIFSAHVEERWSSLSPEERQDAARSIKEETMEGWSSLSLGEREALRATFLTALSVAPLPVEEAQSPSEPSATTVAETDLTGEARAPQSEDTTASVSNIQNNTVTESEAT